MNDNENLKDELIRASIPVSVSTVSILGLQLTDILYLMTILYTFTQMCCLVYKTVKCKKSRKENEQK